MDIHEYLGVLRRGWALIVLGLLVGIAGGLAANAVQPRAYAATSREILTNSEALGDLTQSLQASNLAEGRIGSYVLVATSGLVLQPVIDELKLDMTVQELADHVNVVAPPGTLIVEITATAATPALAKSIANTVSAVFSDVIENQIENAAAPAVGATDATTDATATPVTPASTPVRIVNIEHASLPTAPTLSNAPLLLGVGTILGLALGLIGASLRESLDRRIRGRKDVAAVSDRPVLAQIRPDRGVKASPIVMHTSSQSAIAESFRGLRASVEHVRSRDDVSTFVVTAMAPRQGASLVAANLALAIADTATTVVVIDANLQAPQQAEIFDVDAGPGLTDLLTTTISLDEVIAAGPGDNIWVVPIGSRRARSADLLATPRMRALLAELQSRFDVVIIDTPAISTATDATVLGSFGAATLLVAAEGTATRPALADALGVLAAGGSVPAGIVLNQIPRNTPRGRRPEAPVVQRTPRRGAGTKAPAPAAKTVLEAPAAAVAPVPIPGVEPAPEPVVRSEPSGVDAVPIGRAIPLAPSPAPVDAPEVLPDPVVSAPAAPVVPQLPPPVVESTSGRAAARAARVAMKAAARAAASRPQAPVSRFAPKPTGAVEAAELAAAADRKSWRAPIIDAVPVLEPVDESSNSVIDVPRGDTGERVSLLTPQPGDRTPEELAEIVENQFKDDVVYEIPVEAFGSFHSVDAEAFAAIDNEPTVTPPPVRPEAAAPPLTEENAAFVIDLLADEPVYSQPRFDDWAAATPTPAVAEAAEPDVSVDEPSDIVPEASVVEKPVYEVPVIEPEAVEPPQTAEVAEPTSFVAPAAWPAPRLVADWTFVQPGPAAWPPAPEVPAAEVPAAESSKPAAPPVAEEPVVEEPATEESATEEPIADETQEAPTLARVTMLPTRERLARESYLLKSRELERAAQERLKYEQDRLEARIREQLEADRRQLAGKLDELLEDTVMMPRSVSDGS
ncbi:MAG: hypothetical protein KF761_12960 [Salinibacterium sp.]|nr:hypothetical protein [Salinibacterium sp.]